MNQIRKMTVAVTAALVAGGAMAQPVLEEVVVTAQKRAESVQDVPSTVNVLNGDTMKEFNVQNFTDLAALTPGLAIDRNTGRSGSIALRGITFDPSSAAEAAVTVFWNGSIVDGNAVFQQLFDLERVEILRGPQGTLQGRSSPAGAINIHTAKANVDEMEGQIRATVQDNSGYNTQFGLNVPIVEGVLGARIAGVYDESDLNQVKNDITGDKTHEDSKAGRISLTWFATDSLSVDFAYQYLENDVDALNVLAGTPTGAPVLDPEGILRSLDPYDKRGIIVGPDRTNADYSNSYLEVDWEFDGHQLTSVTGYHETDSKRTFDRAEGNANPENELLRVAKDHREDFTQEIRLANIDADFWEYMVGAYYENSDVTFTQDNFLRPGGPFSPASQVLHFPVETDRWGIFTHNKFYLNDQWNLQLGLRYQDNDSNRDIFLKAGADGFPPDFAPGDLILDVLSKNNEDYSEDAITGAVSVEYAFAEFDTMLYANISTGWRPGGVTVTGAVVPEDFLLFDQEKSASVEVGFKSTLLDGRMRLNGAVFYQEFDDFITRLTRLNVRQLDNVVTQAGITDNADAQISGAELDFDVMLSENWHLGGGVSYTDAKFKSGESLPCNEFDGDGNPLIPEGQTVANCNVGGHRIGSQPNWSASVNTEYTVPLDDFEGYTRGLYRFVDARATEDLGTQSAYSTLELYLGVRGEHWDVSVFARNLFDEEAIRNGSFATQQVRRTNTGYGTRNLLQERLFGLTASYWF